MCIAFFIAIVLIPNYYCGFPKYLITIFLRNIKYYSDNILKNDDIASFFFYKM